MSHHVITYHVLLQRSGLLVNGSNGVVDKIRGQQNAERQYLHITTGSSLCRTQALCINEDTVIVRSQLYRLPPDPETFSAGIHCGPNLKAILQTQQPIQEEGLSSSVQTSNAHHCQPSRNLIQDCHSILLQVALAILPRSEVNPVIVNTRKLLHSFLVAASSFKKSGLPRLPPNAKLFRLPHRFESAAVAHCNMWHLLSPKPLPWQNGMARLQGTHLTAQLIRHKWERC